MPQPKLEYDANTPAFLRRLKGEYGGPGERQRVQFARPKKQLIDAEDDAPTYVDEDNHETISKEEYEKLKRSETEVAAQEPPGESSETGSVDPGKQDAPTAGIEPKTTFGASKKRKAVKVVGDDENSEDAVPSKSSSFESKPASKEKEDDGESIETQSKKPKAVKKAKKIKLSFDDDQT